MRTYWEKPFVSFFRSYVGYVTSNNRIYLLSLKLVNENKRFKALIIQTKRFGTRLSRLGVCCVIYGCVNGFPTYYDPYASRFHNRTRPLR